MTTMYQPRPGDHGQPIPHRNSHASAPLHARDEWTKDGVHHTVDQLFHTGPGSTAYATFHTTRGPVRNSTLRTEGGSGGISGIALSFLDGLVGRRAVRGPVQETRTKTVELEEGTDSQDSEGLAYGDDESEEDDQSAHKRRSFLPAVRSAKQKAGQYRGNRTQPPAQARSYVSPPRHRPRMQRGRSAYETEERHPHWAPSRHERFVEMEEAEDDEPEVYEYRGHPRKPTREQVDMNAVQQLESFIDLQRQHYNTCRVRLEQAVRQPTVSTHELHLLLGELQSYEKRWNRACQDLNEAKKRQRVSRSPQRAAKHQRGDHRGRNDGSQSQNYYEERWRDVSPKAEREQRGHFEARRSSVGSRQSAHSRRVPQQQRSYSFQEEPIFFDPFAHFRSGGHAFPFDDMFGPGNAFEEFFVLPGQHFTDRTFRSRSHANRQARPTYTFRASFGYPDDPPSAAQPQGTRRPSTSGYAYVRNPPPPPPRNRPPPASLLKPEEAKLLFSRYNARWATLAANDPNIPYPARGFAADALRAPDTLWAPHVNAPVSTWSEENIMQANTQAFFLGAVGLAPRYSENPGTARLQMGFDRSQASPAQVKELVDILKKEKMRWHSDRLGRRSGAQPGVVNETLQKDDRARAVFHAVCELMDTAQG